jgi:hypothetical protein
MSNQTAPAVGSGLDVKWLFAELEVPFPPDQVLWRVTNTSNDKKRGQVVPYADQRAYSDRLNALLTPQGWTREYKVETLNNITRQRKNDAVLTGKVLITAAVTIFGVGSHSGTGEEWADDDNAMTSAEAQAFKRACSCFGLGRYFYDLDPVWVDIDQYRQPTKTPILGGWALPENWRKGMRPGRTKAAESPDGSAAEDGSRSASNTPGPRAPQAKQRPASGAVQGPANGSVQQPASGNGKANGSDRPTNGNVSGSRPNGKAATAVNNAKDEGGALDQQIRQLEGKVGRKLYLGILREHGRSNKPELVREIASKKKILSVLESASRGLRRMEAALDKVPEAQVSLLLTKIQAPALNEIGNMQTLTAVVQGLEGMLAGTPAV